MYDIKDIGKRITSYRKSLNMTQEELAARLNITAQAVSKWETGLSLPDIATLPELARAFNTTMDKLFGNEGTEGRYAQNGQLSMPGFPEYMGSTLKLVHTMNNVGCYSEKEVSVTSEDSVIFKDGSSANLKSLKVVNKGPGDICFDFIDALPPVSFDASKTELQQTFEGISSVRLEVNNAIFELIRAKDKKTYVDVTGSPLYIARLRITKDGDVLAIEQEEGNNSSGGMNRANRVVIALGKDAGERIDAQINGEGSCEIKVPFNRGYVSINGSGEITFDAILDVECKINGSGDIKCNKAGNPSIIINGSGDFEAGTVSGSMKSLINGSGDIRLGAGEIDLLEAKIFGSGDIDAENVCTKTANIAIEGSGDITVGRVIEESIEKHSKSSSIKVLKRG
jgi:DNA-binding XRE family transcriptional regulator